MTQRADSSRRRAFLAVVIGCVQFVLLTVVAMWFYPGGTIIDPTISGYSFFGNFFSELGLTQTRAGQPNTVSAMLFVIALTLAGAGLGLFFVAFRAFFTQSLSGKVLSAIGSLFGVISGLCFVGVAFTPANVYGRAHGQFVFWAFEAFPIAVILYAIAILRDRQYPKRFALVFIAFAVLLVLYLLLMMKGPGISSPTGVIIQATGQKIIVYASIVTVFIQALGARKLA